MRQWKDLLASFSTGQRILLLLTAVAVAAGLVGFTRWRRESDFRPLYTALEAGDAGAVVARLKENGVEYRLSEDGRTILVPSAKVAESRLSMATAGLPSNGRIGFELFDKTNFGATEFSEHINYGRALEGELERSVMCLSAVEQARVHLTFPKDSVFLEARQPAKGSVMVKLKPGARLSPQNVLAICHLVASAVEGLAPESVSVLDMNGNLLNRPRKELASGGAEPSGGMVEYRQSLEKDLLAKINSTLEPLLGPENFRASVWLDCDFSSGEQTEETFDPARSVMVSSQKTEDVSGGAAASGVPGTASNLPRPTSRPGSLERNLARRTENITYQSSRVVRRVTLPLGGVKRMSVSVLLDYDERWEGKGAQLHRIANPPSPERIKSIHDLVAAAVGFNADRGDQLIVESLPFESAQKEAPPLSGSPAPVSSPGTPLWLTRFLNNRKLLLFAAAGAGILLLAVFLALLAAGRRRRRNAGMTLPPELPAAGQAEGSAHKTVAPLEETEQAAANRQNGPLELSPPPASKSDLIAGRLREMVRQDPDASAQVLRSWLAGDES